MSDVELQENPSESPSDHDEIEELANPKTAAPVVQPRQNPKDFKRTSSSYKPERRTTDIMEQYEVHDDDEQKRLDQEFHPVLAHFRAVLFRRFITIRRTWLSVLLTIICTVIISCLAIICQVLVESLVKPTTNNYTFALYTSHSNQILLQVDPLYFTNPDIKKFQDYYIDAYKQLFHEDTGNYTEPKLFVSRTDLNRYIYDQKFNFESPNSSIITAVELPTPTEPNKFQMLYNSTQAVTLAMSSLINDQSLSTMNLLRANIRAKALLLWDVIEKKYFATPADPGSIPTIITTIANQCEADNTIDTDTANQWKALAQSEQIKTEMKEGLKSTFGMDFALQMLPKKVMDQVFGQLGPLLIVGGIASTISTFITPPITDINGPIRSYMQSCTLTIFPYWAATFIVDFAVWTIDITVVWAVFMICNIKAFIDNAFNSWYIFWIGGLSFIIYIYAISFCFSSADMASRNAFIINVILLIIPVIVDIVENQLTPNWVNWIYCIFPPLVIQRFLRAVFLNIGVQKKSLDFYWKDDSTYMLALFQWLGIILWSFILWVIETVRVSVQRKNAKSSFGDYSDFFREAKAKHPVTQEANDMAEEVANNHNYAVRIENCSRMFFNTAGNPIPAVNQVSLGVKKGSTFGFLGANGAGKTTLINMITSLLPISDGTIEINGVDITKENDPTLLSVCPQFNTHLLVEMTPSEIFHFFSLLHKMAPDHEERNSQKLLQLLDLTQFKDTPIRELSEGDVRKVAIALSFLGRAEIILLDEPTATLDPVSRHQVHEMISFYKGKKTFMLCTHLLSEAETLCDMISIMIKGNVYTCGSPQYLAAKFGTDYKIDMMLVDDTPETAAKVETFFRNELPQAVLNIARPTARIYNCPAASITLADLFGKIDAGKKGDCGFNYYTCSSSSLERVFMEIVRISENEEAEGFKHLAANNPDADSKKDENKTALP